MMKLGMATLALGGLLFGGPGVASEPPKPNVIYILADDLGYGDLSCYGQEKFTTPHIDRLADEGMKFVNHYSGNTVCSPSRAVLMTGLHPGVCHISGNRADRDATAPDPALTILPEVFQAAGYATGAIGKWGLGPTNKTGPTNPNEQGFDVYSGWVNQGIAHTYFPTSMVRNGKEFPLESGTYIHDLIMADAYAFIRRNAEKGQPFFCYLPTAIPHAAMHAPPALHEKWRKVFPEFDDVIGKYRAPGDEPCPDVVNPIAGFAAMMEHLDNNVGTLLAMPTELGIDKNTLVIFASDNGAHREGGHRPEFWNSTGGLRGKKRDLYEGGIRTPMLARWPGSIEVGSRSGHISAFWDVLPTMCELLGQPFPSQNTGISFLPTLLGNEEGQAQHDYLYFEFEHRGRLRSQAVRMEDWKAFKAVDGAVELFNLAKDPFEENDLAGDHPAKVKKIEAILRRYPETRKGKQE
jgi:arylsulfatase A-like enzyme